MRNNIILYTVTIAPLNMKAKSMYAKIVVLALSLAINVIFFFVLSFSYAIIPEINKSNYNIKDFVW